MDDIAGGPFLDFLRRLAKIFQELAVEELKFTCRSHGTHEPGNAIDDQAKTLFARAQGLLGMLCRIEVQRVVHRQRHLVGNEREKANFLSAIGIGLYTSHSEAPEVPVYCRQRKRADRATPEVFEEPDCQRESGLRV